MEILGTLCPCVRIHHGQQVHPNEDMVEYTVVDWGQSVVKNGYHYFVVEEVDEDGQDAILVCTSAVFVL